MASHLHKDLFKHKQSHAPPLRSEEEEEIEEIIEVDEEVMEKEESVSGGSLTTMRFKTRGKKDYSPVSWETCFTISRDIRIPGTENIFRVYEVPATAPSNGPVFVLHHGAGYSGLSFGLCASHIGQLMEGVVSILAYDCRGHGVTSTSDDNDLSLDRLSQDLVDVVNTALGGEEEAKKRDIFLIGHSMGGCVVADVASKGLLPSITCLAVLDVVEGSAMEALSGMLAFLRTRPTEFRSVEHAIEWSVKSGTIHNLESSRVSVASLIKEGKSPSTGATKYVWRTDLAASQQHWEGWFKGLSEKFLSAKAAKFLILAGTDRLDKPLTIAQMQGKYQLNVMSDVGHMVQEDAPDRTAAKLVEFWKRNERLVLPVKKLTL